MIRRHRRTVTDQGPVESYHSSISDLMAALIFVFIITLAIFALRLGRSIDELKSAKKIQEEILNDIKEKLEERDIRVEIVLKQGVLRISQKGIHFETGRAEPSVSYKRNVGELAQVLSEVLPCYVATADNVESRSSRPEWCAKRLADSERFSCRKRSNLSAKLETMLIEGHTDSRPILTGSPFLDNLDLSAARAAYVFNMMSKCEPRLGSLQNDRGVRVVNVSGYAATRPVDPHDPESERNRRIDLRFLMELPRPIEVREGEVQKELEPARKVRERYER